jgi:hypothetical protein
MASLHCSRLPIRAARSQRIPYHRPSVPMIKTLQCPRRKPSSIAITLAPIQMTASPTATTRSVFENRARRFLHWVRNPTLESPHDAAVFAESDEHSSILHKRIVPHPQFLVSMADISLVNHGVAVGQLSPLFTFPRVLGLGGQQNIDCEPLLPDGES